jgi:hypothetical protein
MTEALHRDLRPQDRLPEAIREAILAPLGEVDLDAPLYLGSDGRRSAFPAEIVKHLKAWP